VSGRLDGKVALITGAARGQGEAEARRFVAEGASVLLTDVLDEQGEALAERLDAAIRPFVRTIREDAPEGSAVVQLTLRAFPNPDVG
jgi:3alpha(or 20beta)-hydroxysteroid dehydrogenase